VHRLSPRAAGPFICLNCAALSDTLLESELFGYEKGAFTGALQAKLGLLEAASSGTLFLDEIGEMSLGLQAKVLRAIETKQVLRVGATKVRAVDVRFVAATNRDLDEEIAAKRFREDLYFRLNGITLAIPPLRERKDELPALARLFLAAGAKQLGEPPPTLAPEALAALRAYSWPGNIRELRNVMERAMLLSSGGHITAQHLPAEKMVRQAPVVAPVADAPAAGAPAPSLSMDEIERQAILDALVRCGGNQTRAAELLGIPRRTFCKKLADHNIPRPRV
jgi:two-component system response regulator AtoC